VPGNTAKHEPNAIASGLTTRPSAASDRSSLIATGLLHRGGPPLRAKALNRFAIPALCGSS
jgi:hypothetical protein